MDKKTLLQYCRFYKGGEKNPFKDDDPRCTAWKIERLYVEAFNDDDVIEDCISQYIRFGMADFSKYDDVPLSLKAVLMNRYFQYTEQTDIEAFKDFYSKTYLNLQ